MSSSTASKLDTLVGLRSAKKLIRRLAVGDLGSHAVLFYGAPGCGKDALARMLAEAWLCRNPGPEGADGACKACASFSRGNNTDFLHIGPLGASRIIPVRAISNDKPDEDDPIPAISFFRTLPLVSRHRVAMIEDAHRMNEDASNSLLKTLEEPHPHAKLILTTDSIGGVRSTILSRCLAVACELPDMDELRQVSPEASESLLRLSGGAPGRLKLLAASPAASAKIIDFAKRLLRMPAGAALVASDEFRELCESFAESQGGARAANAFGLELLASYLAREPEAPPAWTHALVSAHRRILGNGNPTLVFDAAFAKMLLRGV